MAKIYLSSTFKDLATHREKVRLALHQSNHEVRAMEYYAAQDESAQHFCPADVAACEIYVGIFALRYGHVPEDDNPERKSITELEYDEATRRKLPRLIFLIEEDGWPVQLTDYRHRTEANEGGARIEKLRERLATAHGAKPVPGDNPEALAREVVVAVNNHLEKQRTRVATPTTASADRQTLSEYLRWLATNTAEMSFLGLDLKGAANVGLPHVYVPATTVVRETKEIDAEKHMLADHGTVARLLHRLNEESLYVAGAAGTGKSTFCNWVCHVVASGRIPDHAIPTPEEFQETFPEALRGYLPVWCRLREFHTYIKSAGEQHWTAEQFANGLTAWVDAAVKHLSGAQFRAWIETGRCLLVLDGFDEVPETRKHERYTEYPRSLIVSGLADAIEDWTGAGNRILLTSRPYGLSRGERRALHSLADAPLAELPDDLQALFLRRWFFVAKRQEAETLSSGLLAELDHRSDEIGELRGNPMFLNALAVKWAEGKRLPQDVYALYDVVVDMVLHHRFPGGEVDIQRRRLEYIAWAMHTGGERAEFPVPSAEVDEDFVDEALEDFAAQARATETSVVTAIAKRQDLLSQSGILVPRGRGKAGFYHLNFQDYLAAERLRRTQAKVIELIRDHASRPQWRQTLVFLFAALADKGDLETAYREFDDLRRYLGPDRIGANPEPAIVLGACLEIARGKTAAGGLGEIGGAFRAACMTALERTSDASTRVDDELARAALFRSLGRLGLDDRAGVGLKDGLPDIDWVPIPGGRAQLKHDAGEFDVAPFYIARYPVTWAQFQCFVDASNGYRNPAWWCDMPESARDGPARARRPIPSHPRERVSWYEAVAFCRWLSEMLGYEVRLPTDWEWQQAATGGEATNIYPWGAKWLPNRANADARHEQTTAAGLYPLGASLQGVLDMCGNVWEWCLNECDDPSVTSIDSPGRRVMRGGSWNNGADGVRSAHRGGYDPVGRNGVVGFRLARTLKK